MPERAAPEPGLSPRQQSGLRAIGAAALLLAGACGAAPPAPVAIEEGRLIVHNQTDHAWREVEVWVNDHYRVTVARLEARGRFVAPLSTFVAGFGQRFDPRIQQVRGVEVVARDEAGGDVRLVWGTGRRR